MKLHAVYVEEFPPFQNFTINLNSKFDYKVIPNESSQHFFQIERIVNSNKFDVFEEYNCLLTCIAGKNGSGKSTIGLLLKNIFSGQPIISRNNKILLIYENEGQLFLDEYQPDQKYNNYDNKLPINFVSISLKDILKNVTNLNDLEVNRWSKIEKRLMVYSNVLSEINDFYYKSENIINLSMDYKLREFIEKNKQKPITEDIFGFSNIINDYFNYQGYNFMKMVFELKRNFHDDTFFNKIIELPEKIEYYANIKIEKKEWENLGITFPDTIDSLPFINQLYFSNNFKIEEINLSISNQLKLLKVFHQLRIYNKRHENEKMKQFSELILSKVEIDIQKYSLIEPSLVDSFKEIDEAINSIVFQIETTLFSTISADCNDESEKLFDIISKINNDLGVEFISFNMKKRLSSGERVLLNLFTSFESVKDEIRGDNPLIFIDEIEQNLHPEWQRVIIYQILKFFKSRDINDYHLIFTTHSPLVLSDIPNSNIKTFYKNELKSIGGEMTFAGNISDLLYDVMEINSFNGEFTHEIIDDVLNYLNNRESKRFSNDGQIVDLISMIGEPLLQHHLEQMLRLKNQNK